MSDNPTPVPPCRITVEPGDVFTLALRLRGEERQNAALTKIVRLIQEREAARVQQ